MREGSSIAATPDLQAACLTATYINLCWDIPWNRGVRDCMDIVSDVGTVNNCAYPAPCAMATISAVIVTVDATWRCLSQMLLASKDYKREAMAVWSGTSMAPIFAGTSQHGFQFAATEMSHFGGGGGGCSEHDGVDTAGIVFNTTPNMPNIEDQEVGISGALPVPAASAGFGRPGPIPRRPFG